MNIKRPNFGLMPILRRGSKVIISILFIRLVRNVVLLVGGNRDAMFVINFILYTFINLFTLFDCLCLLQSGLVFFVFFSRIFVCVCHYHFNFFLFFITNFPTFSNTKTNFTCSDNIQMLGDT